MGGSGCGEEEGELGVRDGDGEGGGDQLARRADKLEGELEEVAEAEAYLG